jgi:hypothetical protein
MDGHSLCSHNTHSRANIEPPVFAWSLGVRLGQDKAAIAAAVQCFDNGGSHGWQRRPT